MTDKPHPPPKGAEEDRRFKSLLRKLVQVPREEIAEKHQEHEATKRRRKKP